MSDQIALTDMPACGTVGRFHQRAAQLRAAFARPPAFAFAATFIVAS
jgi:hypothetical protein